MVLEEDLKIEDLGRAGFKMYQLKDGFKFGTDSILLAWFAASFIRKSSKKPKILELGANTGAVSLCVAARNCNAFVDSLEVLPKESEVLQMNIDLNNTSDRMRAFNADIRELPLEVKNTQYDVVMFNPPYFNDRNGTIASKKDETMGRREGRFEINGSLDDFIKIASSRVVPSSGHVVMVMHASRLDDAMNAFTSYGIKSTRLMFVHSFDDRNASVFLLAGKKGTNTSDLKILPPLFLNKKDLLTGDIIPTEKLIEIYDKEHSDCFI